MYAICDQFIAPTYKLFFRAEMTSISKDGWDSISQIRNWYLLKHFTYICLVGITTIPNLLPRYVLDKLLLKEFDFQLFEIG